MFDFVYFFIEVKFQEVYFIFSLIIVIFRVFLIFKKKKKKIDCYCYCYCYEILINIIINNIIIICLCIMIVLFVINFGRFKIVLYGFGYFIFIALIVRILNEIFITFNLVSSYMIKFISKAIVFII